MNNWLVQGFADIKITASKHYCALNNSFKLSMPIMIIVLLYTLLYFSENKNQHYLLIGCMK